MRSTDNRNLFTTLIGAAASSGDIAVIPATQATPGDGTASIADGFPAETFISVSAGGKRPRGQDVNGFLNLLSAALQSLQADFFGPYSASFSSAIGGYPLNAVVSSGVAGAFWVSTTENNTSVPGASGATWQNLFAGLALTNGSSSQPFSASNLYASTGVFSNVLAFTSSGSWTVPAGVTQVKATVTGGGGGGSQCNGSDQSGGGGGSGGTAIGIFSVTPGQFISVTVGSGGASQAAGGSSSFGSFCSATGGAAAFFQVAESSAGGTGGVGTGGSINLTGGYGSDGQSSSLIFAGNGGASFWGGGGRAGTSAGKTASAFGAGGGGAYNPSNSGGTYYGGSGAGGVVVLEW